MTNEATATTLEGADAIKLAVDRRGDPDQNDLLTEDGAVEFYRAVPVPSISTSTVPATWWPVTPTTPSPAPSSTSSRHWRDASANAPDRYTRIVPFAKH